MLDNTITLAYDAEGDGNPVDVIIRRFREFAERSVYTFPDHVGGDHNVTLYCTLPKASGNFLGVMRDRQKLTTPVTVVGADGNNVSSAMITEFSDSFPKGVTEAQIIAHLQMGIAIRINEALRQIHILQQET